MVHSRFPARQARQQALRHYRFGSWWLVPVLILATGALYASLQIEPSRQVAQRGLRLHFHGAIQSISGAPAIPTAILRPAVKKPSQWRPTPRPPRPTTATGEIGTTRPAQLSGAEPMDAERFLQQPNGAPTQGHWLVHKVRRGDSLSRILSMLDISPAVAQEIMSSAPVAHYLTKMKPGQTLRVQLDKTDQIRAMLFDTSPLRRVHIVRHNGHLILLC
jgi:NMB0315-like, domain I